MPQFEITAPDGKVYDVTGPEGSTKEQALERVKAQHGASAAPAAAEPAAPDTMSDAASSLGRGLVKGAINFAGMPGDLANLANKGIDKAEEFLGVTPKPIARNVVGSESIQHGVEKLTGKFSEPETTVGKYAQSVGETLGNPASYLGPGSLALKAGGAAATGLASEAAGQLTEGTGLEPYARLAGGIAGGAGAGAIAAERGATKLGAAIPSHPEITANSKAAYKAIEDARLQANLPALSSLATSIKANLENALVSDKGEAGVVFNAVDKVAGGDGSIADIMDLHSRLGKVPPSEGTKFTAAQIAREGIGEWLGKLTPADVVTGDPQFTQAMWDHARLDWLKHKKLEMIEEATTKAQRQASSTGTGANRINKARQAIEKILDSEKKSRGMSPEAKAKMIEIVEGTALTNKARNLSKYAPTGPVSILGPLLTGEVVGGSAGVGLAATGFAAKHLGEYLTDRQLKQLDELIRSESNAGQSILRQQAPERAELKQLVPAQAARSALTSPLAPGQ